ncbi:MAG: aminotransferase class V-fold PLP-dependent enzyme [Candidatus Latescibacteria bacterium]|jgi:aspartate aminotransferase-like enzyme|nr:aminotransferase class V-fold PLP-dependent enzyme [Candidatus Latescibacterota bacterium]
MDPGLTRAFEALRLPEPTLWAPGPHGLTPAVKGILEGYRATYTHRSAPYREVYAEATDLLRDLFSLPDGFVPLVFGHTASYGWEMVAANTPAEYRTLGMDLGAFSGKWPDVFRRRGRSIEVLRAEWGEGIEIDRWEAALRGGCDLALITHNETSTGVALPVEAMCDTVRDGAPDALIAVDGVSIAGAIDLRFDNLRSDYYFWSLQKDFCLPAIGSVMVVSPRAIDIARQVLERGYVLDLVEWVDKAADRQTPMTVPDLTLQCLVARLQEMHNEGDARFRRHEALARAQREWARGQGLEVVAAAGYESPTVTAIRLPEGVLGSDFVATAQDLLNVQLAPGYGPMRDTAFRIAAMGTTSEAHMAQVLEGLSLILRHWDSLKP